MQAKGRPFKITIDFLREKFGERKLNSFFETFPEYKNITSYSDIDWYPLDDLIALSDRADKFFGFGDHSVLIDLGKYSAEKAMESSHKLFMGSSPEAMISRAQALFSSYYSSGTMESEFKGKNRAELILKDFPLSDGIIKRILGWMRACLKMTGAKNISVKQGPVKKGAVCFLVEWKN
ncbi:MAG TPA: DUF2378 family protein [Spirochaetota bacterium]|nr:DUF2378 family protein [Spirochaetota bacterium]